MISAGRESLTYGDVLSDSTYSDRNVSTCSPTSSEAVMDSRSSCGQTAAQAFSICWEGKEAELEEEEEDHEDIFLHGLLSRVCRPLSLGAEHGVRMQPSLKESKTIKPTKE
ncbi:UNVERIFIED_CONTAM: hypothetical protein FKN15_007184 [Acipenser sinensis]